MYNTIANKKMFDLAKYESEVMFVQTIIESVHKPLDIS